MLARLIGYFGDFDLAEEAAAEAFAIAAQRWASGAVPDNPGAWLVTTARHRAIDRLRRDRVLAAKLPLLVPERAQETAEDSVTEPPIPDERLELVFICCNPALAIEAQVALTLRAVGGLTTEEIARAFLVPAETMKRRLTRAKSKIKVAGIPFAVPPGPRLPERLDWLQIAALYGELADLTGSDVVRLNRAVAIAESEGAAAALAVVDGLDLPDYQYWHSTRAELLRRLGRADEARAAYQRALDLARTTPERRFLERRIAES